MVLEPFYKKLTTSSLMAHTNYS